MRHITFLLPAASLLFTACQTTAPTQYDKADLNADGKLTYDEASDYLVTSNFTSLDANKDGAVSKAEWNPEGDAASAKLFAQRDANRDGVVTLAEALAFAKKKGTYEPVAKEADTDKDGFISRKEATAYTASKEGPVR